VTFFIEKNQNIVSFYGHISAKLYVVQGFAVGGRRLAAENSLILLTGLRAL
jgi:hypothetical protein